jgi:hypothetical protein
MMNQMKMNNMMDNATRKMASSEKMVKEAMSNFSDLSHFLDAKTMQMLHRDNTVALVHILLVISNILPNVAFNTWTASMDNPALSPVSIKHDNASCKPTHCTSLIFYFF